MYTYESLVWIDETKLECGDYISNNPNAFHLLEPNPEKWIGCVCNRF